MPRDAGCLKAAACQAAPHCHHQAEGWRRVRLPQLLLQVAKPDFLQIQDAWGACITRRASALGARRDRPQARRARLQPPATLQCKTY